MHSLLELRGSRWKKIATRGGNGRLPGVDQLVCWYARVRFEIGHCHPMAVLEAESRTRREQRYGEMQARLECPLKSSPLGRVTRVLERVASSRTGISHVTQVATE